MWHMLSSDQLVAEYDPEKARAVFKRGVTQVEIEIFSYCNRKCWFCPNSVVDRISTNKFMDPAIYSSILDQLQSIAFSGTISYSRYNEPFADDIIFERLQEARDKLPAAILHTNTNGDYLDMERLEKAYQAGLRSLNIQFYLKNEEAYDHDKMKFRAQQIRQRLPLDYELTVDKPGEWLGYASSYKDMAIKAYGRNFALNGTNRGEQVDIKMDYERYSPCLMPFWAIYIDYNGKTMPCCNVRSDIDEHVPYVMADLTKSGDIFLNYTNDLTAELRRSMLTSEKKGSLCGSCNFVLETVGDTEQALMDRLQDEAQAKQYA